jgi:hypothetical protein
MGFREWTWQGYWKRNDAVATLKETAYVNAGCICGLYRFKTIAVASDLS